MSDFDDGSPHFILDIKDESGLSSSRYLTLTLRAVLSHGPGGTIRNPSRSYIMSDPNAKWADFVVTAQLDESGDWYAQRFGYREVFSMDLRDAEVMTKNLRDITRKLERLDAKFGRPTDFAAYAARVADAAGADERPFIRLHKEGPGFGYDSNEYRWLNTDDLRYHLSEVVRQWREKHGFTAAS